MTKRVGLYLPPKNPELKQLHKSGVFPPAVLDELQQILAEDDIEIVNDLNPREARMENDKVYVGDTCLSDLDVYVWFYPMMADREGFEINALRALNEHTKVVPNPEGLYRGLDKFHSHTILKAAGLPTPNFALFRSDDFDTARRLFREWGSLLLKPSLGNFGRGIVKVESEQQLIDVIQFANTDYERPYQVFVEQFTPNDMEKWISTTVIGSELVYGYRKKSSKIADGWKVFDEQGVGGETYYVDPAPVAEIVKAAQEALGADIIGFDCIYTESGDYVIVDENTFPGMYDVCFTESGKGSWAENFARLVRESL